MKKFIYLLVFGALFALVSCDNDALVEDLGPETTDPTEIIIIIVDGQDTTVVQNNNDPTILVTDQNTVGNHQFMNLRFLNLQDQLIELVFRPVAGDCVLDATPTAPSGAVRWDGGFVHTNTTQLFLDEPYTGGATLVLRPDSDDSLVTLDFRLTGLDSSCRYDVDIVCSNNVIETVHYPI